MCSLVAIADQQHSMCDLISNWEKISRMRNKALAFITWHRGRCAACSYIDTEHLRDHKRCSFSRAKIVDTII